MKTARLLVFEVLLATVVPLVAGDWPRWGGGSDSDRASDESAHGVPTVAWTSALPAGVEVNSSPAVDDGRVIFGANDGTVRALDEGTGATVWQFSAADIIVSSPAVFAGSVFVGGRDGRLYCLRSRTGELLWQADLVGHVLSSPVADGNGVYVAVGFPASRYVALDRATGAIRWSVPAGQTTSSSPCLGGGLLFVAADGGVLRALDPATGAEIWRHSTAGSPYLSSPMFQGGVVYFTAGGNDLSLYAHNAATGLHAWVRPCTDVGEPASTVQSTCPEQPGETTRVRVGVDHRVSSPAYVRTGGGDLVCAIVSIDTLRVYAVRVSDGTIAWVRSLGATTPSANYASSVAAANGLVYVGSQEDRRLYVLDAAAGGTVLGWVDVGAPVFGSPAIANGRVYVGTAGGVLYALDSPFNRAPGTPDAATFVPSGSVDTTSNTPTITWAPPTDPNPGGDPPAGLSYRLRYDFDGEVDEDWIEELSSAPGAALVTIGTPVPDGSRVFYRVRARDSNGAESRWSALADFFVNRGTTPPLPPTDLLALPRDDAADLSWSPSPSSDVRFYNISWGTGSAQVPGTQTTYRIDGLTNNTTYTCSVVAEDFDGQLSSATTDSVTPRPPVSLNGAAYATPQDALDAAAGGQEVILGPERFAIASPLRIREGVTLRGFSALHTVLEGPGAGTLVSVERTNGMTAVLHSLLLRGGDLGIDARGTRLDLHHIVVAGCGTGIRVMSGAFVQAWNVTVAENSGTAFLGTGGRLTARNCAVIRNGGRGFDDGSGLFSGTYNDVFGNVGGDYVGMAPGTGDISEDVAFLDPAASDYREPTGSAVVDSGDLADGFANEPMPNGNRINQGAFGDTRFAARSLSYTVSGVVTRYGVPFPGIDVELSGTVAAIDTTDGTGAYDFPGLFRGPYTVTPTTPGYKYVPASRTFDLRETLAAQDFAAFPRIYSISGRVTLNGQPFAGATIDLSGDETASVATDANGDYLFANLPDGNYVVTPRGASYGWSPASRAVVVAAGSVPGQDFTASLLAPPVVASGGVYYPTIDAALGALPPGSTITLFQGTYVGAVILPGGISLVGAGPHLTTIDGQGATQTILVAGNAAQPPTLLTGFRVTGGGVGIEIGGSAGDDPNVSLTHLIVSRNTGDGIHGTCLASLTGDFLTIANNGGDGLDLSLASARVNDSILHRNGGVGARNRGSSASLTLDHPCLSGNGAGLVAGTLTAIGWHQALPVFLDEANDDYRSRYDCPTIDRARATASFANEPAPNGGRADQGAFGDTPWAATLSGYDTIEEIALAGGRGNRGWVEVRSHRAAGYRHVGWVQLPWAAYDASDGAVHPALGNLDGQAGCEVVMGTNQGGWVAVHHRVGNTTRLLRWVRVPWPSYDSAVGVTWPACGDVDGDGVDELVIGLGPYPTNGGWAVVLDDWNATFRTLRWLRLSRAAYNQASGETRVACGDVDGDGRAEVVVGTGRAPGVGGFAEVFDDAVAGFVRMAAITHPDGVYVEASGETWPATGDLGGDGRAEVLLGPGRGGRGVVQVFADAAGGFASTGVRVLPWSAYNASQGEVRVACGNLDTDAAEEVIGAQGPWTPGGRAYVWDTPDGWLLYEWTGYNGANGELFPAVGNLR